MIWESKELFSHQLLRKKDTESVFTVFWLRTTPFLLSLVPLFLLIYCFHFFTVKMIQRIKRSEWFSKLWWRESISQRKKQNFLNLNRIMYFSSFFIIRHTFLLSFHIFIVNILWTFSLSSKNQHFPIHIHLLILHTTYCWHLILWTEMKEWDERMKW